MATASFVDIANLFYKNDLNPCGEEFFDLFFKCVPKMNEMWNRIGNNHASKINEFRENMIESLKETIDNVIEGEEELMEDIAENIEKKREKLKLLCLEMQLEFDSLKSSKKEASKTTLLDLERCMNDDLDFLQSEKKKRLDEFKLKECNLPMPRSLKKLKRFNHSPSEGALVKRIKLEPNIIESNVVCISVNPQIEAFDFGQTNSPVFEQPPSNTTKRKRSISVPFARFTSESKIPIRIAVVTSQRMVFDQANSATVSTTMSNTKRVTRKRSKSVHVVQFTSQSKIPIRIAVTSAIESTNVPVTAAAAISNTKRGEKKRSISVQFATAAARTKLPILSASTKKSECISNKITTTSCNKIVKKWDPFYYKPIFFKHNFANNFLN